MPFPWRDLISKENLTALLAALVTAVVCNASRHRLAIAQSTAGPDVAGIGRVRRHRYVLPRKPGLAELPLDILIASPPADVKRNVNEGPDLVFYVLDPEPILFGASALFAYGQAAYFKEMEPTAGVEAAFRRLHVVGVGHAAESFRLSETGFDASSLRNLRRRDFPPFDHPAMAPGRGRNSHARRFVEGLADEVVPFVEEHLLGLPLSTPGVDSVNAEGQRTIRCLLGASYSAVMALQVLMARPKVFRYFVLGSPSVCFDPEILNDVAIGDFAIAAVADEVRVQILIGEREREGLVCPGNVHDQMAAGTAQLAQALKQRGVHVDGVSELPMEDHSTIKLALVGRGLTWFASQCRLPCTS